MDHLPPGMSFFQDHRVYLQQHSTDPDRDELPGYYHYIDIDYYPEFFTGTLPSNWDTILALYGYEIVTTNGIVPWVIEWWTDSLSILMSSGQWDDVWQVAAELGHYIADSHQPLHLTLNYDGQLSDNHGIHRRYETNMTSMHLPQLPPPDNKVIFWENVIDSVFQYIDEFYPYVDSIISADDLAKAQDPTYGTVYYDLLWAELDTITTETIQHAIIDLASVWYTVWINAEKPIPPVESAAIINIPAEQELPYQYAMYQNYPNPFNPITTIQYDLPEQSHVYILIYDILGREIRKLVTTTQDAGNKSIIWDGIDEFGRSVGTGIYLYQIQAGDFIQTRKMLLFR